MFSAESIILPGGLLRAPSVALPRQSPTAGRSSLSPLASRAALKTGASRVAPGWPNRGQGEHNWLFCQRGDLRPGNDVPGRYQDFGDPDWQVWRGAARTWPRGSSSRKRRGGVRKAAAGSWRNGIVACAEPPGGKMAGGHSLSPQCLECLPCATRIRARWVDTGCSAASGKAGRAWRYWLWVLPEAGRRSSFCRHPRTRRSAAALSASVGASRDRQKRRPPQEQARGRLRLRRRLPARPLYGQVDQRDRRRRVVLGDRKRRRTVPESG